MVTAFPERCLEAKHLAKALSFGPVFEAPFIDQGKNGARSRAAIGAQDLLDARLEGSVFDYIAPAQYIERISDHVATLYQVLARSGCRQTLWRMSVFGLLRLCLGCNYGMTVAQARAARIKACCRVARNPGNCEVAGVQRFGRRGASGRMIFGF
jgi:hypothetical protein